MSRTVSRPARAVVAAAALVVVLMVLVWGFLLEPSAWVDETGLFNPAYSWAYHGRMAYPAYGPGHFNRMVVHPPTHYFLIGSLLKLDLPLRYAIPVPTVVAFLVAIGAICFGPFSPGTAVALLFGLLAGPTVAHGLGTDFFAFGICSDLHVAAAWFAGLVCLGAGRLREWSRGWLAAGAFLLTWAAAVHYYWIAAPGGVLVLALWARASGDAAASRRALQGLAAGVALFAAPYLVVYLARNGLEALEFIRSAEPVGTPASGWRKHAEIFAYIHATLAGQPLLRTVAWPASIFAVPMLFCLPVLALFRETRGLALAALPSLLFVTVLVQRKTATYAAPELMLCAAALAVAVLACVQGLAARFAPRSAAWLAPSLGLAALVVLAVRSPALSEVEFTLEPQVHEMQVARAAGKRMLGANALVGARLARFYTSGERHSYMIERDLTWDDPDYPHLASFFGQFDALSEDVHMADVTHNRTRDTLSTWYLQKALHLRGGYLSPRHPGLAYVLFAARPAPERSFFARVDAHDVARFVEDPRGERRALVRTCPAGSGASGAEVAHAMLLPHGEGAPLRELVLAIHAAPSPTPPGCEEVESFAVRRELVPIAELLRELEGEPPIDFHERLGDAVAARAASRAPAPPGTAPSHLVLVVIDQLRADRLRAYGSRDRLTPFLDGLARQGFRFDRARSAAPWTYPSVVSLLTGLYPSSHGGGRFRRGDERWLGAVPQGISSLAERLRDRGFETAGFVANPYLNSETGVAQGFDLWIDDFVKRWRGRRDPTQWWQASSYAESLNARVLDQVRASSAPRRFLYLHYIDVHGPWSFAPFLDATERELLSPAEQQDQGIRYVDARLQELFAELDRLWDGDLLFVVTSDHGQAERQQDRSSPLKRSKASLHEFNLRVPLLVARTRTMPVHGSSELNVSLVDLAPTLLELAGEAPGTAAGDGRSLVPLLTGGSAEGWRERRVYAENTSGGWVSEAVVAGTRKLVAVRSPKRAQLVYDLAEDPGELAPRPARLDGGTEVEFQRLDQDLQALRERAARSEAVRLDDETVGRLRALGYLAE